MGYRGDQATGCKQMLKLFEEQLPEDKTRQNRR